MNFVAVAGARPNFMKIKPVMDALERAGAIVHLVHSGQHYDANLSDVFFDELGIRPPDFSLGVGSGTHARQTARVMETFEPVLSELDADMVVVVGDVNSTLACAIVAAKAGCLVAHVEAGLRSRDWAMPEEINRVVTDRVSDYLLAPSPDAVDNLRAEGYRDDQIHLVGNVMVDTLLSNLDRARARPIVEELGLEPGRYALVTLHRPANVDDPATLGGILDSIEPAARELPFVLPAHPRTRKHLEGMTVPPGMRLMEPVGYLDFVALEASARVVLTDSGGVQEETTVLGIPCLTLRENTERPITVTEGTNQVVGRDPDRIRTALEAALSGRVAPRRPELWDGRASERIAEVLLAAGSTPDHPRPTDKAGGRDDASGIGPALEHARKEVS
ncbi:MAG TPA: UDP-N-acetylglucosamine 2-epimerase (non-hydrolyzing) [Actinomycetota bacterium]